MSDLVVIGKVSSARGLKGQFKIISYTKNAEDIFNYGPITIGDKYIDVQLYVYVFISNSYWTIIKNIFSILSIRNNFKLPFKTSC